MSKREPTIPTGETTDTPLERTVETDAETLRGQIEATQECGQR